MAMALSSAQRKVMGSRARPWRAGRPPSNAVSAHKAPGRCNGPLACGGGADAVLDQEPSLCGEFEIAPGEHKLRALGEIALATILPQAADFDCCCAIADRASGDGKIRLLRAAPRWNGHAETGVRGLGGEQLGEWGSLSRGTGQGWRWNGPSIRH